jgi:hypothetical protein
MNTDISKLLADMRALQDQLEDILDEARERFRYTMEDGRAHFTREVQLLQRRYRVSSIRYLLDSDWRSIVTAPVIYAMLIPLTAVDLSFSLYQHICFRAYGVPRVRRRDYLVNDRHRLVYLNTIEKVNCAYCGYGNGVIAYAREIISRTEQYWCPIRHANRVTDPHARYVRFFPFGDAQGYQNGAMDKRQALREEPHDHS